MISTIIPSTSTCRNKSNRFHFGGAFPNASTAWVSLRAVLVAYWFCRFYPSCSLISFGCVGWVQFVWDVELGLPQYGKMPCNIEIIFFGNKNPIIAKRKETNNPLIENIESKLNPSVAILKIKNTKYPKIKPHINPKNLFIILARTWAKIRGFCFCFCLFSKEVHYLAYFISCTSNFVCGYDWTTN